MQKTFTLILILAFFTKVCFAQIDWVRQSMENPAASSSPGTAISHDIALDSNGDVLITGSFSGQSKFGQIQFPEDPFNSMFLAKYKNDGDLSWAVRMTGNGNNESYAIATNDSQHVYIAGEYRQTNDLTILNFGNGLTLEGNGSPSSFLAKADSDGNFIWANRILATPLPGQNHEAIVSDIQVDPNGNIYMLGHMVDSVLIDSTWLNTQNPDQAMMFLAKYLPNGELAWFKQSNLIDGSGPAFIFPGHMAIGSQGQLYINGEFLTLSILGDLLAWEADTIETVLDDGQFLARFDANGELEWWQSMNTGSGHQFPHEMGIDDQDNIYLTLQKSGNFEFSDGQVNGNDFKGHVMLLKYNAAGQRQFIKDMAHGNVASSSDIWDGSVTIHTRPNGTTFMSGQYASQSSSYIVFGNRDTFPTYVPSTEGPRQFLAAFDSDGNYLDVGFMVDDYPTAPSFYWENTAMVSDALGKFYMTGKFAGNLGLGVDSLVTPSGGSAGGQAFAIKFDPLGFLDLSTTSIKDQDLLNQQLSLYPNPAKDQVMIDISKIEGGHQTQLQIFNLQGQLIQKQIFQGNQHQIDVRDWENGLYFCQIQVSDKILTRRLYIQH